MGEDQLRLITRQAEWEEVGSRFLKEPRLAVDMEADGFHHYPDRVCLIQLATPQHKALLDPLAVEDLSLLGKIFREPGIEKVFHSADYDLRSLERDFGFRVCNLFDTAVGAKFLGLAHGGLGKVLQELLGICIDKSVRLQRSDWSQRPLPLEAIRYAAADVAYLITLREAMGVRLANLGRTAWVAEECERLEAIRYIPPDPPETAFLAVKGSGVLDAQGLAVLRELFRFREKEAYRLCRPPFKVLQAKVLIALAQQPHQDPANLSGVPERLLQEAGERLRQALARGQAAPPVQRPQGGAPPPKWTAPARARLAALKAWRQDQGTRLGLDPALLWPLASLERLARWPDKRQAELGSPGPPEVRAWQRRAFADDLRSLLMAS